MHKLAIVHYEPWHLAEIKMKRCHDTEKPLEINSRAYTFLLKDEPIAIFGGTFIMPGVYSFWGFVSEGCRRVPIAFHKSVLVLISHYEDNYSLRRIQMTVRKDYIEGVQWAESLGFQCEGVMRKYGHDGSDYLLFARVS